MSLDVDLAGDMDQVFADWGVSRTYTPRGSSGRAITVIENIRAIGPLDPTPGALSPIGEILVRNSSTTGIARADLDTGGDTIQVLINGALQTRPISRVLEEDDTVLKLEVR